MVGNTVGAFSGVVAWKIANKSQFAACALAVALSIILMSYLRALHPPGGAAGLIACLSVDQRLRGWRYILFPAFTASVLHLCIGLIFNNLAATDPQRRYPMYWIPFELPWMRTSESKRQMLDGSTTPYLIEQDAEGVQEPSSTTVPGGGAIFHTDLDTVVPMPMAQLGTSVSAV